MTHSSTTINLQMQLISAYDTKLYKMPVSNNNYGMIKPDSSAYRLDETWPISASMGGGWRTPFNVLFFSPRVKDTDRLEKCPAVFTIIISRNDSTILLLLSTFHWPPFSAPSGGFPDPAPSRGTEAAPTRQRPRGLQSRRTPPHIPGPRRPCPLPSPAGLAYPGSSRHRPSAWEGTSGYSPDTRGLVFPAAAGSGRWT